MNSLSLDGLIGYDPMGSAYAFSPFGFSGQYAGFGDTEIGRSNTALKYRGEFANFRVGGARADRRLQPGQRLDLNCGRARSARTSISSAASSRSTPSATTPRTQSAPRPSPEPARSSESGPFKGQAACISGIPKFYSTDDLKATLSNNTGTWLLAKYKLPQFPLTISGGWGWWRLANPSDDFSNGFKTIGGYNVPANITGNKAFPTVWVTSNAYNDNRIFNMFFIGGKYAVTTRSMSRPPIITASRTTTIPRAPPALPRTPPSSNPMDMPRGFPHQQQRLRGLGRLRVVHGRLPAGQAGGHLRRRHALERLRGPRQRIPATQSIAPTAGLRVKF